MWGRGARITESMSLVAAGTEVIGDIHFSGELEVQGMVCGNITASQDNARVRIVKGGQVKGEVRAPLIVISGDVQGDIHASEQVELVSEARVQGNIHYRAIEIARGAQLNGKLIHVAEPQQVVVEDECEVMGLDPAIG